MDESCFAAVMLFKYTLNAVLFSWFAHVKLADNCGITHAGTFSKVLRHKQVELQIYSAVYC
jgi:hypothetical protein